MARRALLMMLLALGVSAAPATASDHADVPILPESSRPDVDFSDLHVFTNEGRVVISLSTFPNLPSATYQFAADLTLRLHIDNHSSVAYDDAIANEQFGGRIVEPEKVSADIVLEVTFDELGRPRLHASGLGGLDKSGVRLFAGPRDDPFIRGPQAGRNVASVVVELPLENVLGDTSTLLVWGSSKVPDIIGPQVDLGARALRSRCIQDVCTRADGFDVDLRNQTSPHKYARELGLNPDVVIFDPFRPARFPNGRALTDDVVNLVAKFGEDLLASDFPCPSENDVPFLPAFPYLAPPHVWPAPPLEPGPACR